jgi:hypothetical protein
VKPQNMTTEQLAAKIDKCAEARKRARDAGDSAVEQLAADTQRPFLRELRRRSIAAAGLTEFVESFNERVTGTFTRTDNTSFDYDYRVRDIGFGDMVLSLERCDVRDIDDEGSWRGNIELRLRSRTKYESYGSNVNIYGPELDRWYSRSDDYETAVKEAEVSMSSGGRSILEARATAALLNIAADAAAAWTEAARPELVKKADELRADWQERQKQLNEERKRDDERRAKIREHLLEQVRVTLEDRKTPVSGQLVEQTTNDQHIKFIIKTSYGAEVDFRLHQLVKLEVKNPITGRYSDRNF